MFPFDSIISSLFLTVSTEADSACERKHFLSKEEGESVIAVSHYIATRNYVQFLSYPYGFQEIDCGGFLLHIILTCCKYLTIT